MDHVGSVADHLLRGILDVAAGTAVAGCITHQARLPVTIKAEGSFPLPQRPETFAAGAAVVAVADDDSNFDLIFLFHSLSSSY